MKHFVSIMRRVHSGWLLLAGSVCLACAAMLLLDHVRVVQQVRNISVPLVAQLAQLERRETTLQAQVELSQLQSAVTVGSLGEKLDAYVLPQELDYDRVIALFDLLSDTLTQQKLLAKMSDIQIDDEEQIDSNGLHIHPVRVAFTAHQEGVEQILLLTRLSGLLTVSDALTADEVELLFSGTEEENPAGIIALEQFLSLDLLRYAQDSKGYEEQVHRSLTSPLFERIFQSVLQNSLLRDARRIFGGDFGRLLLEQRVWPTPFFTVHEMHIRPGSAPGWYYLDLVIHAWEKDS